jgi:protein-tyrosine phosphatase
VIDLHTHVLVGIDDGARSEAETLEMARLFVEDDCHAVAATPHVKRGVWENRAETIAAGVRGLNELYRAHGLALEVVPGAELHYDGEWPVPAADLARYALGGGDAGGAGRHLLVELCWSVFPLPFFDDVHRLRARGLTVVLAHPERYAYLDRPFYEEAAAAGVLFQITAAALTGEHGSDERKTARELVRAGFAHLVASDAHGPDRRPPGMTRARREVEKLLGAGAGRLFVENPARIARGESLEG